jgi:hypothetical protein
LYLTCVPALAAQTTGTVDVGVSTVSVEGFLASGAAFATPSLRFEAPNAMLAVQGTYLVFESGNTVLQGSVFGAALTPRIGRLRGEVSGTAGIGTYADFPRSGHALARGRAHAIGRGYGMWVGGTAGATFLGPTTRSVSGVGLGAWVTPRIFTLGAHVQRTWVGDTAYLDIEGRARWTLASVEFDGSTGVRTWSRGGGRGVYGEVSARAAVGRRVAVLVSGGRYPSDPARGVLAGRYLSAGLQFRAFTVGQRPPPRISRLLRQPPEEFRLPLSPATVRIELISYSDSQRTIRVHAATARTVEIMADFTDWHPVTMRDLDGGRWELQTSIVPGVHRLNVRVDGGPWLVPQGARVERDEFGGEVGVFVVW